MDTRHQPHQLHTFELITANNFEDHLPSIEKALRLKKDKLLTAILPPDQLARLKQELSTSLFAIIDALDRKIIDITYDENEEPEVASLMQTKSNELKTALHDLYDYLNNQQAAHLTLQSDEIEKVRQIILNADGCYAGNHGMTLDILKRNIAITLQNAAHAVYTNQELVRTNPLNFNRIFKNISHINQHGEISHSTLTENQYADCELNELQTILSEIIADCGELKEQAVMQEIKNHLKTLNHLSGHPLIKDKILLEMRNLSVHFTTHAHDLEEQALTAAITAKRALHELDVSEDAKITAFEEDKKVIEYKQKINEKIARAETEIDLSRQLPSRKLADNPAIAPEPAKPGFWQRHPVFKKVCIGALIGLGIIAVAAIVIGAIILAGGVAATALTTFAGAIAAKFGIAGAIGFGALAALPVITISAASGGLAGDIQEHQQKLKQQTTTTTLIKELSNGPSLSSNPSKALDLETTVTDPMKSPTNMKPLPAIPTASDQPMTRGLRK